LPNHPSSYRRALFNRAGFRKNNPSGADNCGALRAFSSTGLIETRDFVVPELVARQKPERLIEFFAGLVAPRFHSAQDECRTGEVNSEMLSEGGIQGI
jgi:hypothetical protein